MTRQLALALALLLAPVATLAGCANVGAPPSAQGSTIAGPAAVIDGDTLEINGTRVRLHGVDAPESDQTCTAESASYRCGQESAVLLSELIGGGIVTCRQRDIDHYGRTVAVCYLDDLDLNAWLVENGLVLAYRQYSQEYVHEERHAQGSAHGLWRGQFVEPWQWREGIRLEPPSPAVATDGGEHSPAPVAASQGSPTQLGYTARDRSTVPSLTPSAPVPPQTITLPGRSGPSCAENGSCYGDIIKLTGRSKTTYVKGYYRKDGTYVRSHYRSKRRRK